MKLFFKILTGLAILLLLVAGGLILAFDANNYKQELAALVKQHTGRDLQIKGDVSLSLFPWLGIKLGEMELGNAKGFGNRPFARIQQLQVRVKLLPLLKQQLQADTLVIDGLSLNLMKNRKGISNWANLSRPRQPSSSNDKPAAATSGTTVATDMLAALAINGIRVNRASFTWQDRQQQQFITVKPLQLEIGQIRANTDIPLVVHLNLQQHKGLKAAVSMHSRLRFSADLQQLSLHKLKLDTTLTPADYPALKLLLTLDKLMLNQKQQRAQLRQLVLQKDDMHISGNASVNLTNMATEANLAINRINLDDYIPASPATTETTSTTTKKTTKQKEAEIIPLALLSSLRLKAKLDIDALQVRNTLWQQIQLVATANNGNLSIKPIMANGYDATVKAFLRIKTRGHSATVSGSLDITDISAGKLLDDLLQTDKLKGKATLKATFNSRGLTLSQLRKQLDGSLQLRLSDATLKGFDLLHQKRTLDALLKKQSPPPAPKNPQTRIARLSATAMIKKGVLSNRDLRAATPLSRIAGQGKVNLVNETIDYVAAVKFVSELDINDTRRYEAINAIPLDILIKGGFKRPVIKVDFDSVLKRLLNREVKKQQKKIEQKVKKDIENEIRKKLGNELQKLLKF